jgi:hypothetical protein
VEILYKSPTSIRLRLWRAVEVRRFCLKDAEQDGGFVDGGWLDQAQPFLGGELLDRVRGTWGATPVDGLSATP